MVTPGIPATGEAAHRSPSLVGNDYELLSVLGRGGGAVVYRAFSRSRNEDVAVKLPDPTLEASGRHFAAVAQEAQRLQALHHPNIVPVLAVGQEQGVPYFVMPLAPMGSLRSMLERSNGPPPLAWTARMVSLVASALQTLHDHGQVHLDVKPGNILLAEGDWPLLADFATAARTDAVWNPVGRWRLPGTLTYMSPEHEHGQRVEAASDQYSLALVAWEVLTGLRPARPFDSTAAPLPASVAAVLNRALSDRPDQRFGNVTLFAAAFSEAVADVAADDHRAHRRRLVLTLGALPALGLVGAFCVTAGPRPLLWDWPWFLGLLVLLAAVRVWLHRPLLGVLTRLTETLLSASPPGGQEAALERRRVLRGLDAAGDTVVGLLGGVLLAPLLIAFFGTVVSPLRAALLTAGALSLPWLVLAFRLTWLGRVRGLATALLLSLPAFEMFLGPAVLAQGDQTPVLVVHLALAAQLTAVLLLSRDALQLPVQHVLARWLEVALLGGYRPASWADVLEVRRQFGVAAGETLDLTLVVLVVGAFLAPLLRWLAPGAPWLWSLIAVLAMLLLVWVRWLLRVHTIAAEWRAATRATRPLPHQAT